MAINTVSDLCNLALTLIGEKRVTDVTTDTTKGGVLCNALYQDAIDEVLVEHTWSCATDRARLYYKTDAFTGISLANPAVITFTDGSYYSNGDKILIVSVDDAEDDLHTYIEEKEFTLKGNSGETFQLYDSDGEDAIDLSTGYDGMTITGTARIKYDEMEYRFDLPTDCLAVANVPDALGNWKVEGSLIYYDQDEIVIDYIKQVTTVTGLSRWLREPIAYNLAAKLCDAIKGSGGDSYMKLYFMMLQKARMIEGRWMQSRDEMDFEYAVDV